MTSTRTRMDGEHRGQADTKAKKATGLGKSMGYPLYFTTEPEE